MQVMLEDVELVVRSVVRRYGHCFNESSSYTDRNGRHCLAGKVLLGLGVPIPNAGDGCNDAPVDSTPVQAFYAAKGVDFSNEAIAYLRRVQDAADYGVRHNEQRNWRHAVEDPLDFNFNGTNPRKGW